MTGFDLAKEMLSIDNRILIVICSRHSWVMESRSVLEGGIKRAVLKPAKVHNLPREVQQVLGHSTVESV